jgi:hypothetical protein
VISWRYHVVSIVAVILAFGLGILAGTSVVGDRFARDLQLNYEEAIRERDEALATVALYERLAGELQPTLRDDVLLGETAVVVTMEGVEGPARRAVEELTAAGVEVTATLQLTRRLAESESAENAAILQEVLGVDSTAPETLRDRVIDELSVRLAAGPDAGDDDVLERLLGEGLITADRDLETDALQGLGGDGQLIVLAAGGPAPQGFPSPQAFLVPLTERLVRLDVASAAVGPREDPYGFVSSIRDASDVPDCALVTVDDMDLTIGGLALVMGLERLLDDPDPTVLPGGDYGVDGHAIVPGAEEVPGSCRR